MQIKTLEDVLHWTTAYHELLSDSIAHAVERAENGAVSLLLDYLAKHESTLAQLIRLLEQTADAKTLSTLCSEYLDSRPVFQYHQRNEDLAELTINDIATKLVREHQQLIELYRFGLHDTLAEKRLDLVFFVPDLTQHFTIVLAE